MRIERKTGGLLPPQAKDLEDAIIGAMLVSPDSIEKVSARITADDFYSDQNQRIFIAMQEMINRGARIDFLTVCDHLRKKKELEAVGGAYYVSSLTSNVVSAAHIEEHAKIVKEMAIKRNIIRVGMEMVANGYDEAVDAFELHDKSVNLVSDIISGINRSKIETIGQVMTKAVQESLERKDNQVEIIGLSSGIPSLDRLIGGFCDSDYIILAAGTGEGKSTLALNIADHISSQGIPTAFFTLEMKNKQLAYKILSKGTESPIKNLRLGNLPENKWTSVLEQQGKYSDVPLYLNDSAGMTVTELCAIVRAMVKNKGVRIVFIDYLQLLLAGVKVGLREQEVNYISKQLRQLALELNIPIVALSQLSRLEKGASRLYQLSDLRESGAIEQDATNVLFIYKPILPNQNRNVQELTVDGYGRFHTTTDDALIISAKNRNDSTGAIRVKEQFWASRFVDYVQDAQTTAPEPYKVARPTHYPDNLIPLAEANKKFEEEDELPF